MPMPSSWHPSIPNFASLNLAQAVLLLSYEWMKQGGGGTLGRVTTYEQPLQPGLKTRGSPPASREELTGFFEHLERELDAKGFFTAPGKASQRGAEPAFDVRPHGRNRTGNPHLAGNRQGAGKSPAIGVAPALVMPPFPPSDALNNSSNKTNSNEANEPMGAGLSKRCWSKIAGCAGVGASFLLAVAVTAAGSSPVLAQNKELSDKSVQMLMQYAWALTPPKFTAPDGKTIEVDKTKPKDVIVSIDVAREVITVARLSAHAQSCELAEEQRANYLTLMRREAGQVHLERSAAPVHQSTAHYTVMMMTGKLLLVEKEGEKLVSGRRSKPSRAESCTDTERQRVKTQIVAYINAAPTPAAKAAEPVKAGTQKK